MRIIKFFSTTILLCASMASAMNMNAPQNPQQATLGEPIVIDDRAPFSRPVMPVAKSSGSFGRGCSETQSEKKVRIDRQNSDTIKLVVAGLASCFTYNKCSFSRPKDLSLRAYLDLQKLEKVTGDYLNGYLYHNGISNVREHYDKPTDSFIRSYPLWQCATVIIGAYIVYMIIKKSIDVYNSTQIGSVQSLVNNGTSVNATKEERLNSCNGRDHMHMQRLINLSNSQAARDKAISSMNFTSGK